MKAFIVTLGLGVCLVVGALTGAVAADLPRTQPEAVGLSSERLARFEAKLRADIEKQMIPGAVLLVAREGKIAYFEAFGIQDPATKAPMRRDSIFRIYSMTKPITSVTAMMLVEEGRMTLSDPAAKYLPALAKMQVGVETPAAEAGGKPSFELIPARRPISLQDLLRHTSGFTYGFFGEGAVKQLYRENLQSGDYTNAEFVELIAKQPLAYHPGTIWDYSYSTDVLGRVIEVVDGVPLSQSFRTRLFDPLGMPDTAFAVTDAKQQERIAEPFQDDRSLGGGVMFFDPRVAGKWESGGGGLVGTAMDYARFLQMLLNGGELDGRRYLSPRTVAYMTSDHMGQGVKPGPYYLPGPGYGFGLGFGVRLDDGVSPHPGSEGDYYWGGAGGTYFWVDPEEEMFVIFMMQSPKQRLHYRAAVRDMIYAAIVK
jgi:CubicO group peptidase (beta-lactamase class C family)